MSDDQSLQYQNSALMFVREAVSNAVAANDLDPKRWVFAFLHIVIAIEALLKAKLCQVHPALSLIKPTDDRKTVGLEEAVARLESKSIYGLALTERDKRNLINAVKARNAIAHGKPDFDDKSTPVRFFQLYSFACSFSRQHLKYIIEHDIDRQVLRMLLEQAKYNNEQLKRAKQEADGSYSHIHCWICYNNYFEEYKDKIICLICSNTSGVSTCDRCGELMADHMLFDITHYFEWEYSEGTGNLANDYGISERVCCENCSTVVHEEIERMREDELFQWQEEF